MSHARVGMMAIAAPPKSSVITVASPAIRSPD